MIQHKAKIDRGRQIVRALLGEILKEVAKINKVYRIVFHTIAIGQFQKTFLRTLAMQNGGEFVDLGY